MADNDVRAEHRLGRIVFRAWRRGFREADLILGPFAEREGPTLTDEELADFEALLDQDDYPVYAWITRAEPTPADFETPLMSRLRAFMDAHVAAAVADGAG